MLHNPRYKWLIGKIVVVGILIFAVVDYFNEFTANEGFEYYRLKPWLLGVALGVGCVAAVLVWGFSLFSKQHRRQFQIFGWAVANVAFTVFALFLYSPAFHTAWYYWRYGDNMLEGISNVYVFGLPVLATIGLYFSWWSWLRLVKKQKSKEELHDKENSDIL